MRTTIRSRSAWWPALAVLSLLTTVPAAGQAVKPAATPPPPAATSGSGTYSVEVIVFRAPGGGSDAALSAAPSRGASDTAGTQFCLQGEPAADGRIALRLEDWQRLERILATLREAGCRIEEMELAHTDLEDVFLRIMAQGSHAPVSQGAPS
jgi:hypothetical protein